MKKSAQNNKQKLSLLLSALAIAAIIAAVFFLVPKLFPESPLEDLLQTEKPDISAPDSPFSLDSVPEYADEPFCVVNGGVPYFTEDEITDKSFERYSPLDSLGRCGIAFACVGRDLMPTEERESISHVKPTGWQSIRYDHVDGKSLYNRCHLIGFQLTGENANAKNLITGTRYMNVDGMLPFENMIADYVEETGNHVMYRVTPVFKDSELVARGVLMEAYSVEDKGEGVCFNVFAYNVQPLVTINYEDGSSYETAVGEAEGTYILNTSSKKFHSPECSSVEDISEKNKEEYKGLRKTLVDWGYVPCGYCDP